MRGALRGFTLVEVLVALVIVAMGLAALMTAVSSTASASGYLREKALAQWIGLNRIVEVRLNVQKFAANTDTGELEYANRQWHYDTRYFDTSIATMRRVVVRVWAGKADAKSNPLAEMTGFLGTSLSVPGSSNVAFADQATRPGTAAAAATGTPGNPAKPGAPTPGSPGVTGPGVTGPGGTGAGGTGPGVTGPGGPPVQTQ